MKRSFFFAPLALCLSLSACSVTGTQAKTAAQNVAVNCALPAVVQLSEQLAPDLLTLLEQGASASAVETFEQQAEAQAPGTGLSAALCALQQISTATSVNSAPVSSTVKASAAGHLKASHSAVKFSR